MDCHQNKSLAANSFESIQRKGRMPFGATMRRRTNAYVSVALQAEGENVSKLEKADILVRLAYVYNTLLLLRIFSFKYFFATLEIDSWSNWLSFAGVDSETSAQDGTGSEVVCPLPPRGSAEVPGGLYQLRQRSCLVPSLCPGG